MYLSKKTFGLISGSIGVLILTFFSIFNWGRGLGGTGAHADVYDDLFTIYWGLGTVIGIGVYSYFLWLLTTSTDEEVDEMVIGRDPVVRGDSKVAFAIALIITFFLLILSDATFDSIDFFEEPETNEDSFTVFVTGYQYYWEYHYPNGLNYTSSNGGPLRIPVDVPVVFEVSSGDVFHSFALPEHRIKIDALPSRANIGWILAEETGEYPIRCFELCGDYHSLMIGHLEVMEQEEFDAWYSGGMSS